MNSIRFDITIANSAGREKTNASICIKFLKMIKQTFLIDKWVRIVYTTEKERTATAPADMRVSRLRRMFDITIASMWHIIRRS